MSPEEMETILDQDPSFLIRTQSGDGTTATTAGVDEPDWNMGDQYFDSPDAALGDMSQYQKLLQILQVMEEIIRNSFRRNVSRKNFESGGPDFLLQSKLEHVKSYLSFPKFQNTSLNC